VIPASSPSGSRRPARGGRDDRRRQRLEHGHHRHRLCEAISSIYAQEVAIDSLRRLGGPSIRTPLEIRPRVWFNADLESRNYIIRD